MNIGSNVKTIQVIKEFDQNTNYGVNIPEQVSQCLAVLRKGEKFTINDFVNKHLNEFTTKNTTKSTNQCLVYKAFGIGEKIGLIQEAESKGLTLDEFVKLESVEYFLEHYSKSRYKNISPDKHGFGGTQRAYSYALKNFNNWLIGKELEYQKLIPTGNDNYKKVTESVTLNGLEDLLRLFKDSPGNESQFIKIIKKYLLDSCHQGKSSTTMNSIYHAITVYFEKNETPVHFRFNSKTKYDNQTELEDFVQIRLPASDLEINCNIAYDIQPPKLEKRFVSATLILLYLSLGLLLFLIVIEKNQAFEVIRNFLYLDNNQMILEFSRSASKIILEKVFEISGGIIAGSVAIAGLVKSTLFSRARIFYLGATILGIFAIMYKGG